MDQARISKKPAVTILLTGDPNEAENESTILDKRLERREQRIG